MYDRRVKGQTINFQVSGMLWQRSLVMRDVETGSLWSHLLGKAMRGKLEGAELAMLPGAMTTWKEWRTRHPDTTVLGMSRTAERFREKVWDTPQRYVFGIPLGGDRPSPAVSIEKLMSVHLLNLDAAGESLLVTFGREGQRAQAFDRKLGEKVIRFEAAAEGKMKDTGTSSTWDAVTGECLVGTLKGKKLKLRPGTISYRKAWRAFFPEGKIAE